MSSCTSTSRTWAGQSLRVEDGVVVVHCNLVLRCVANETLGVGEGDIGGRGAMWCGVVDVLERGTKARVVLRKLEFAQHDTGFRLLWSQSQSQIGAALVCEGPPVCRGACYSPQKA